MNVKALIKDNTSTKIAQWLYLLAQFYFFFFLRIFENKFV